MTKAAEAGGEKKLWRRIKDFSASYPSSLVYLVLILGAVAASGLVISATTFVATGVQDGAFSRPFCLTNECATEAANLFVQSLEILKSTVGLLSAIATVGGILVALLGYLNSASVSALGNHIAHFNVFQSFLASEIARRHLVSPASVDVYMWYRTIFHQSRSGVTAVSSRYVGLIEDIANEIERSNLQAKKAHEGSFRYVEHQNRIIEALAGVGITLTRHPRIDFFQVERELFSLISSVNAAFCYQREARELPRVEYH